jgi:signal transduction histidine kinase
MTAAAGPASWMLLALLCMLAGAGIAAFAWRAALRMRGRAAFASDTAQLACAADATWHAGPDLVLDRVSARRTVAAPSQPLPRHPWQWLDPRAPRPREMQRAMRAGAPFFDVLLVAPRDDGANPVEVAAGDSDAADRDNTVGGNTGDDDLGDDDMGDDGAAVARAAARRLAAPDAPAPRVVALSGMPLFDADGTLRAYAGTTRELGGLLAACVDATAAHAEDGAAQVAALQARGAEQARQFEFVVKELESFAHSVSHDLRAPLRVIDGFATIVLEDYDTRLDDLGREHLKRIVAAAGRMNAMIDTLLTLSRTTSRTLEHERVDLSRLAGELAEELAASDRTRSVEFVIAPGLHADGDRTLLRLVLQNLLGNAFKFTSRTVAARIEVGRETEPGSAGESRHHGVVGGDRGGGAGAWFVRDNGAGFDMRFADKLFGVFQRLHSQNEFPGTGVGLATVQRIVRSHGGRIWAQSEPGKGATFYFTLWEHLAPLADRPV